MHVHENVVFVRPCVRLPASLPFSLSLFASVLPPSLPRIFLGLTFFLYLCLCFTRDPSLNHSLFLTFTFTGRTVQSLIDYDTKREAFVPGLGIARDELKN